MFAAVLALGAAVVFGTATALQHREASAVAASADGSGGLLPRLLRRPAWVVGLGLSGVAFVLHVAALHAGPLTLVQPIVVTTTVFAVFVRSGLDRTLPDRAEVLWAACTWVGLTLFVTTVGRHPAGRVADDRTAVAFLVSAAVLAVVATVLARLTRVPPRRGSLLGVAAGILYGSTAGLIKVAASHAHHGPGPGSGHGLPLLHHWSVWLVAPVGLCAFYLSQRAFQAARLSSSVPVLNIVDVLVAVAFGVTVFGERLYTSPGQLALEVVGALMIGVGVWRLVREGELLHERHLAAAAREADAARAGAGSGPVPPAGGPGTR